MITRRHRPPAFHTPITLRECPWPGTRNRWRRTSNPARAKRSASRCCARCSRSEPAGRGPACAIDTATRSAVAAGEGGGGAASSTVRLEGAAPRDHGRDGLEQDRQVEADRPALEIQEVQPDQVVEVELRAPGHLPQPGDPRQHEVALLVPFVELVEVA